MWAVDAPIEAPRATNSGAAAPVVVLDDVSSRRTVVLDAADGRTLLQRTGTSYVDVGATPELLLLNDAPDTVAVDRAAGAERWRTRGSLTVAESGLLVEDYSADPASPGRARGVLDPATGRPRWILADPPFSDGALAGDLYVRSVDDDVDTVTAADPATGAPRWSVPVEAAIGRADAVRLDPTTLVLTPGGSLDLTGGNGGAVALSTLDGRPLWTARGVNDGPPEPLRSGDRAAIVLRGDVIDARTGAVRRLGGLGRVSGGAVYAVGGDPTDGTVRALGVLDDRELWRFTVPGNERLREAIPVPDGVVTKTSPDDGTQTRLTGYLG